MFPPKNEQPYYFWTVVRMYGIGIGADPVEHCRTVVALLSSGPQFCGNPCTGFMGSVKAGNNLAVHGGMSRRVR
ncbi:hypothetical protein E5S69_10375 [Cupriavidus necator]|nr:hypothetical protein [Cupriavidus necator]